MTISDLVERAGGVDECSALTAIPKSSLYQYLRGQPIPKDRDRAVTAWMNLPDRTFKKLLDAYLPRKNN